MHTSVKHIICESVFFYVSSIQLLRPSFCLIHLNYSDRNIRHKYVTKPKHLAKHWWNR